MDTSEKALNKAQTYYPLLGVTPRYFLAILVSLTQILLLFMVLDHLLISQTQLTEQGYQQTVLVLALITHHSAHPWLIALIVCAALVILWRYPAFLSPWKNLDSGHLIRLFVVFVAGILAWRFTTYDYNLYYGQAHYLDRILLLALLPLIYWRPLFIFPFIVILSVVIWQFAHPIAPYSWAQQYMPIRLMTLFGSAFIVTCITGKQRTMDFIFLTCCLVISHYWVPGVGKFQLDWFSHGHIYNLLPATYANGWLAFLHPDQLSAITSLVAEFDEVMIAFTLLLEWGALLVLWRKLTLLPFLCAAILFHLGVFFLSGIFFWQWIAIDTALILLLQQIQHRRIFNRPYFFLSILLIGGAPFWFKPVKLAWYDSPMSYTFRIEGLDSHGQRIPLPPAFFAPYDYQFTQSNFSYLVPRPSLGLVWGATRNYSLIQALNNAQTPGEVKTIELTKGKFRFNDSKGQQFDTFIQKFVGNFNQRGSKKTWLTPLKSPSQLWTLSPGPTGFSSITQVRVYLISSLFQHGQYIEFGNELVREITIPVKGHHPAPLQATILATVGEDS